MAYIDGEFDDSEREGLVYCLKRDHQLPDDAVDGLIRSAREELQGSVDLWHFARRINQEYSLEKKLQLVETIWQLAYMDGRLDKHEDYLIHKLAKLLRLTHKQLIDAKLKAKNKKQLSAKDSQTDTQENPPPVSK